MGSIPTRSRHRSRRLPPMLSLLSILAAFLAASLVLGLLTLMELGLF